MKLISNTSLIAEAGAAEPVVHGRAATAAAIAFGPLVDALATAAAEHQQGRIHSPERLSVPLTDEGVCLSMPASAAAVSAQPAFRRPWRRANR